MGGLGWGFVGECLIGIGRTDHVDHVREGTPVRLGGFERLDERWPGCGLTRGHELDVMIDALLGCFRFVDPGPSSNNKASNGNGQHPIGMRTGRQT